MEKTPEAFSDFGRQVLDLLFTVTDGMLAHPAAKKPIEWDVASLLAEVRRAARAVNHCVTTVGAKTLLHSDAENGFAICWLNSALSPQQQKDAMHLAFDRTCDAGPSSPGAAFSAYLVAMCDGPAQTPDEPPPNTRKT